MRSRPADVLEGLRDRGESLECFIDSLLSLAASDWRELQRDRAKRQEPDWSPEEQLWIEDAGRDAVEMRRRMCREAA